MRTFVLSFVCLLRGHKSPIATAPVKGWIAGTSSKPLQCTRCNAHIMVRGDGNVMVRPG